MTDYHPETLRYLYRVLGLSDEQLAQVIDYPDTLLLDRFIASGLRPRGERAEYADLPYMSVRHSWPSGYTVEELAEHYEISEMVVATLLERNHFIAPRKPRPSTDREEAITYLSSVDYSDLPTERLLAIVHQTRDAMALEEQDAPRHGSAYPDHRALNESRKTHRPALVERMKKDRRERALLAREDVYTVEEAESRGWYTRSRLYREFDLRPVKDQEPEGYIYYFHHLRDVYDRTKCREVYPMSEAQKATLEKANRARREKMQKTG